MDNYQNQYRIKSTRLQRWDYGWSASYYITICTCHRTCYFGQIKSGEMYLSEIGNIARKCWIEIPIHFPLVELSDFVIMPNHIHGILSIKNNFHPTNVETRHALSLQYGDDQQNSYRPLTPGQKRFQNQGRNTVSSIIGAYKSAVTRNSRKRGFEFLWQNRFWDHVIRDINEIQRIRNYITDNPSKWKDDEFLSPEF